MITKKQMGDACEMLVAAELTLAGIPTVKYPDGWPEYDIVAQLGAADVRIQVKSCTFKLGGGAYIAYDGRDDFHWIALVLLPGDGETRRCIYLVPKVVADGMARRDQSLNTCHLRYWRIDEVARYFEAYEGNFRLECPQAPGAPVGEAA